MLDKISTHGYYLKRLESFGAYLEKAEKTNDMEMLVKCEIVKKHHVRIPDFVDIIHTQNRKVMFGSSEISLVPILI